MKGTIQILLNPGNTYTAKTFFSRQDRVEKVETELAALPDLSFQRSDVEVGDKIESPQECLLMGGVCVSVHDPLNI